jgi:hypothetical protein
MPKVNPHKKRTVMTMNIIKAKGIENTPMKATNKRNKNISRIIYSYTNRITQSMKECNNYFKKG